MQTVQDMLKQFLSQAKTLQKKQEKIQQYMELERQKDKITNPVLATAQKKVIEKERTQLQDEVKKEYKAWFDTVSAFLEEHNIDSVFPDSKNQLGIDLRLDKGIHALLKLKNSDGKSAAQPDKWKQLIASGESDQVEFKSSLHWDYNKNELNKHLELGVIKTVAAFLNSKGGFLLLGISDEGNILGVKKEYPTLKRQDGDGYIQYLIQILSAKLGKECNEHVTLSILQIDGKDICVIKVLASKKPFFLKHDNSEHFFIRASLTSQPLNVREATEYIQSHW